MSNFKNSSNDNNDDEKVFKIKTLLLDYSTNTKNYAKWFEISEIDKNRNTFTKYKLVYRVVLFITI